MHCQSCKLEIQQGVRYCPYCGAEVSAESPPATPQPRDNQAGAEAGEPETPAEQLKSKIKETYYIQKDLDETMQYITQFYSQFGDDIEVDRFHQKVIKKLGKGKEPLLHDQAATTPEPKPTETAAATSPPQQKEIIDGTGDEIFDLDNNYASQEPEQKNIPVQEPPHEEKPTLISDEAEDHLRGLDEENVEIFSDEPDLAEGLSLADDDSKEVLELKEEDVLELDEEMMEPVEEEGQEEKLALVEDKLPPREAESLKQEEEPFETGEKSPIGQENEPLGQEEEPPQHEEYVDPLPDLEVVDSSEEFATIPVSEDSTRGPSPEAPALEPMLSGEPEPMILSHTPPASDGVKNMLQNLKNKTNIFQNKLFIIGAAAGLVVLILVIYIFSSNSSEPDPSAQEIQPATARREESRRQQRTTPVKKPSTQPKKDTATEKSLPADGDTQKFQNSLKLAQDFLEKGDLANAEKMLAQAKKIKSTPEVRQLASRIEDKKKERVILSEAVVEETDQPVSPEERAHQRAMNSPTIANLEAFIEKYPTSIYGDSIRVKLTELNKAERRRWEGKLKQDVRQYHKIYLRSSPGNLNAQESQALLTQAKAKTYRYRLHTLDGTKIVVDYATGLMWHPWERAIDFQKAQWWAARRHAGFHNWRMPTAEEAAALINGGVRYFSNLAAARGEIWTSDRDSQNTKNAWVLALKSSVFKPVSLYDYKYLWSVRNIK